MRGFLKNISVIFLILLALSVVASSIHTSYTQKKSISSSESAQKKDKQETVTVAQDIVALIPFIHFDLVKDLYLIRVFKFPVERRVSYFNNSELPFTIKYFKALFCFVISPNAP